MRAHVKIASLIVSYCTSAKHICVIRRFVCSFCLSLSLSLSLFLSLSLSLSLSVLSRALNRFDIYNMHNTSIIHSNGSPCTRQLEETTRASAYHVPEHRPARSESLQPHTERSSHWPGPEPSSVMEAEVYVWCYTLLVVHARQAEDNTSNWTEGIGLQHVHRIQWNWASSFISQCWSSTR